MSEVSLENITETVNKFSGTRVCIPVHDGEDFSGKADLIPSIPKKTLKKTRDFIMARVNSSGKFPSMTDISKKVGISKGKTSIVLKALFAEGFLERKGNRYIVSENAFNSFASVNPLDKAKAAMQLSPGMLILKAIIFLIGVGASGMSIFHSTNFLSDFYAATLALICAIIMVTFNIISTELSIHFYQKRYWGITALFAVLLCIGTLFSMGSTIMGLYNTRTKILTEEILTENVDTQELQEKQLDYQNISEKKDAAIQDLRTKQSRVNSMISTVNSYTIDDKIENSRLFEDDNYRLILANRDLKAAQEVYNNIMQQEAIFLSTEVITTSEAQETPPNAYIWIGTTLNIDPDLIQFSLSCYPAIFYDIIAPIAFSIVLFMNNSTKKKIKKRKKNRRNKKRSKK